MPRTEQLNPVCFVDTETTALDRDVRQIWEVALITPDGAETLWRLPVDLAEADPMSLGINGFHDRYPYWHTPEEERPAILRDFAQHFAALTRDLHLAGACVHFDEHTLWDLLRANGECPMWHYHIIDVEALAAGWLRWQSDQAKRVFAQPPWKSTDLSLAVGVNPDSFARHSAMGDARWAKAIYEAVMG